MKTLLFPNIATINAVICFSIEMFRFDCQAWQVGQTVSFPGKSFGFGQGEFQDVSELGFLYKMFENI